MCENRCTADCQTGVLVEANLGWWMQGILGRSPKYVANAVRGARLSLCSNHLHHALCQHNVTLRRNAELLCQARSMETTQPDRNRRLPRRRAGACRPGKRLQNMDLLTVARPRMQTFEEALNATDFVSVGKRPFREMSANDTPPPSRRTRSCCDRNQREFVELVIVQL